MTIKPFSIPTSLEVGLQQQTLLFRTAFLTLFGLFALSGWSSAQAQMTLAGSLISNQAQAQVEGTTYVSNVVETMVQAVCSPSLTPNGSQVSPAQRAVVVAGGYAYFPYLLRNTGNYRAAFALSQAQGSTLWSPNRVRMYSDDNQNSRIDLGEAEVNSLTLDVGEQRRLVMEVAVPNNVSGDLLITPIATCATGERDDDNFSQVTVGSGPSLNLTKSSDATLLDSNQEVTFTLRLSNLGDQRSVGPILVTDWFNTTELAGLSYVSDSSQALKGQLEYSDGNLWSNTPPANVQGIRLRLDGLNSGEEAIFSFRMRLAEGSAPGLRRNIATAEGQGGPARAAIEVLVASRYAHRVGPLGNPEANAEADRQTGLARIGQTFCFSHSLVNLGNAADSYLLEVSPLPQGVVAQFRQNGNSLVQPLRLNSGQRSDFQLCLSGLSERTPNFDLTLNAISQASNAVDPTYDSLTLSYDPSQVQLLKTADKSSVMPGEEVVYSLQVSNPFPGALTRVRIEDPLDSRLEFVAASDGGTFDSSTRTVVWNLPDLAPGQTRSFTLRARIALTAKDGVIPNRLLLRADQLGDPAVSEIVNLNVLTSSLLLQKQVNPKQASFGDLLTYTVVLQNTGNTELIVDLNDTPGPGLQYVLGTAAPAISSQKGEQITWSNLTLPAGASLTFSYKMRVLVGAPERLENVARATATNSVGAAVAAASAAASVKLDKAVFIPANQLVGRVYLDTNRDGRYTVGVDVPLPGSRVVLGNGLQALTDLEGRYAFRELSGGVWEVFLDPSSAPFKPLPHPERIGDGYRHKVNVLGLTQSDFPLERPQGQAMVGRDTTLEFGPLKVYKRLVPLPSGVRVVLEVSSSEPLTDLTLTDPLPGGGQQEFKFALLEGLQTLTYDLPAAPGMYLTDPQARWKYP